MAPVTVTNRLGPIAPRLPVPKGSGRTRLDTELGIGEMDARLRGIRPVGSLPEAAPAVSAPEPAMPKLVNVDSSLWERPASKQSNAVPGMSAGTPLTSMPIQSQYDVIDMSKGLTPKQPPVSSPSSVKPPAPVASRTGIAPANTLVSLPEPIGMPEPPRLPGSAPLITEKQSAGPLPQPIGGFVESNGVRTEFGANGRPVPSARVGTIAEMAGLKAQAERQAQAPAGGIAPAQSLADQADELDFAWASNPMNRDKPEAREVLARLGGGGRAERMAGLGLKQTAADKEADRISREKVASIKETLPPIDAKAFEVAIGGIDTDIENLESALRETPKPGFFGGGEQAAIDDLNTKIAAKKAQKQDMIDQLTQGNPLRDRAAQSIDDYAAAKEITTQAEYDALPAGAPYIDSKGQKRRKAK